LRFSGLVVVFLSSSRRETAKNVIKNRRKKMTESKFIFLNLFVKCGVFELLFLRNAQKRHNNKAKNEGKKGTHQPRLVAICLY
jgi:hypothetical protein